MNERDYQRLKRSIEDDYRRKMEALETVWQIVRGVSDQSPCMPKAARSVEQPAATVISTVEPLLGSLPDVFTIKDVEIRLSEGATRPERSSISHALKRMQADGKLAVVETGRGKRPTKYCISSRMPGGKSGRFDLSESKSMATERDRVELIELMKSAGAKPSEFKGKLLREYGVERVLDLTKQQVDELKAAYGEVASTTTQSA